MRKPGLIINEQASMKDIDNPNYIYIYLRSDKRRNGMTC